VAGAAVISHPRWSQQWPGPVGVAEEMPLLTGPALLGFFLDPHPSLTILSPTTSLSHPPHSAGHPSPSILVVSSIAGALLAPRTWGNHT
jgi:hypothetical protein